MASRCDEGKKRYTSHADATKAVILWAYAAWRKQSTKRVPIRIYRCPFCEHWHLTSQQKRDPGEAARRRFEERRMRRERETPIFFRLLFGFPDARKLARGTAPRNK